MEPIQVNIRFNQDGTIDPYSMLQHGVEQIFLSTGRRWVDRDGQHILAMLPGNRVVELVFNQEQLRWYLKTIPGERFRA